MRNQRALRAILVVAAAAALTGSWISIRMFYSRYYAVMARRGMMSESEHVERLQKSVEYDPSFGFGRLMRAEYLMKKGRLEEAEEELERGMGASRPASAYLLKGVLAERQKKPAEAKEAYEIVLAVVPEQVTAMERLAVLAYQEGDEKRVEELAREIARVDLNNPNPLYLLAVAAERSGDPHAAFRYYQKISAAGQPRSGALYDLAAIRGRLDELKTQAAQR